MEVSGKTLRTAERAVHLALGGLLLALSLTPLRDTAIADPLRIVAAVLVILSGVLMWQHGRVVRALKTANTPIRIK